MANKGTRSRALAATVAAVLVLGLAACGGDDEAASDDGAASDTTGATADDAAAGDDDTGDAGGPCEVVDAEAVGSALGGTVGAGEAGSTMVQEDDLSWTAETCEWESDSGIEIELGLVAADGLPGACPPLSSPVYEISELPDLGDQAWFEFDELQGEGAVRACVAGGMAEGRVESGDTPLDEATVQATARALVEPALAAL